eukprot:7016232-Pyramimonas_sp.AAC.1
MTDDVANSEFLSSRDEATLRSAQTCTGLYFNTGLEHGGGYAWKSARKTDIGGEAAHVYIFRSEGGWRGSDAMWST